MALEAIVEFFKWFNQILGAATQAVWLPIFLFIIAVILRAPVGRAFRAAVIIGVAWIGITLVINLFFGGYGGVSIPDAAAAIRDRFGLALEGIDVGWPPMAAIAYGTLVGAMIIPIGFIVNLLLLALKLTKTFDIDVWNFWHWAFVGGTVYTLTGDLSFALLAAVTYEVFCLKVADWTVKPLWDLFPGYKGYSIPQGGGWVGSIPFIAIFKPIVDRIPTPKADPETLRQKLGVLGEPAILGLIIGALLGVFAGFNAIGIALLAIGAAAVMMLLPRMIGLLMEGLTVIADSVSEYVRKRFAGRELYIGMDAAIAIGHPTTIAAALLLIPIVLIWAAVFSAVGLIKILPFADLAATPFFVVAAVPFVRGDLIKSIILGALIMLLWQILGSWWAPILTETAKVVGWTLPAGASLVGSIWLQPMIVPAYLSYLVNTAVYGVGHVILIIIIAITLFADRSKTLREAFSKLYK
ncbi:MAG: PTS transporter subunit IIC [Desulfurococcaceae archaeon]